jgi:hypothetical protein
MFSNPDARACLLCADGRDAYAVRATCVSAFKVNLMIRADEIQTVNLSLNQLVRQMPLAVSHHRS